MVSFLHLFRALCLPANEPRDALHIAELHISVHALKAYFQALHRFIRRGEEFHRLVDFFYESVRPSALARHIEAAAERTARLQHTERLAVCRLLIGEGVEAVERQHDIKAAVLIRQRAHVALPELHILESHALSLFPRLPHHVG